jgi:protein-tyrosine phosphatase
MIDIHAHIIPSIDDGCKNINETLQIVKEAVNSGVDKIFATSHYLQGKYENTRGNILVRVDYINNVLKNSGINVTIVSGSEILVCPNIINLLKSGELCTLNGSKYILIEFPVDIRISNMYQVIGEILAAGFIPIISHPERYEYVQNNIEDAIKYVESGALLQLNIGSLIGDYGEKVKATSIELLKRNLIHMWGSDSHFTRGVYPRLQNGLNELKKIVGENMYKQITEINPNCVYNNENISVSDIKHDLEIFS